MIALVLAILAASEPSQPARQPGPKITTESGGSGRAFRRWESGQWQVLAGPDYCAADFEEGNIQFSIEKYWWTGDVQMQLMSRDWLSLTARNGQRASLRVTVNGTTSWTSRQAIIAGNPTFAGFVMVLEGSEAAGVPPRLASATSIDFAADGRTLGTYEVEGAADAMEALEACVSVMRRSDHSDPFAPRRP